MKKLLLLSLLFAFLIPTSLKASHMLGGEITWQCLSNGKYVFYAKVYRDCTGINFPFNNKNLEIVGAILPRDASNNIISSIILKPDSNAWISNNFGDISPAPTSPVCASNNQIITCANGDPGAVQEFPFQSDPIELFGVPPTSGWKLFLTQPCCRPNITNLAGGGTMLLRAEMYDPGHSVVAGQCYDSSPLFYASPTYTFCRGVSLSNQFAAYDLDLDSLVYTWDRTYNSPTTAPQPVPYANGYNFDNPTPDSTFNVMNQRSLMDPNSGLVKFAVYNGSPLTLDYLGVMRVEAYRNGQLISAVNRELPIVLFDCPTLQNNQPNHKPSLSFAGQPKQIEINVRAGDLVQVPISTTEQDSSSSSLQSIKMIANGNAFSADFATPSNCSNPPCAVLQNNIPVFDSTSAEYQLTGTGAIATSFSWQTACNHAGSNGDAKSYYFYFDSEDDHCPISLSENGYIRVNVFPREYSRPTNFCGQVGGSGLQLTWDPSNADTATFISWRIYKKSANATSFQLLDSVNTFNTTTFVDPNFNAQQTAEYKVAAFSNQCGSARQGRFSNEFSTSNLAPIAVSQNLRTFSTTNTGTYQWYNCGLNTLVPNATSSTFTPLDSGSYSLILYRGDCIDTSACYFVGTVGIQENRLKDQLSIYPNPNQGMVYLKEALTESMQMQLFSLHGQIIQNTILAAGTKQIELPAQSGIYVLQLQNSKGEKAHFKLIRE